MGLFGVGFFSFTFVSAGVGDDGRSGAFGSTRTGLPGFSGFAVSVRVSGRVVRCCGTGVTAGGAVAGCSGPEIRWSLEGAGCSGAAILWSFAGGEGIGWGSGSVRVSGSFGLVPGGSTLACGSLGVVRCSVFGAGTVLRSSGSVGMASFSSGKGSRPGRASSGCVGCGRLGRISGTCGIRGCS
jgi:hypothetical protein